MSLRSIARKTFAVSPVILIGAVCAQSRFYRDPFQPVSCTAAEESAIAAYAKPVRLVRELATKDSTTSEAREVAKFWVNGSANGDLKALPPCSLDDNMRSPIKGQIFAAAEDLVQKLTVDGNTEREEGKSWQAAQDHLLALKVCEVVKYSDTISVAVMSSRECSLLASIESDTKAVGASQKAAVRGSLLAFKERQQPMDNIYRNLKYLYGAESQRLDQNEVSSIDPDMATEVALIEDPMSYKTAAKKLEEKGHDIKAMAPMLLEFDMAYRSQKRLGGNIDEEISKLPNKSQQLSA